MIISVLNQLRDEWIKDRDKHPAGSAEERMFHFGIYGIEEAINSLKAGKVCRYHGYNTKFKPGTKNADTTREQI